MNNTYMTYEEYLNWDREYRYYESLIELRMLYVENLDKDDMDYPPIEYWESCVSE
jgi:hypothetical protein